MNLIHLRNRLILIVAFIVSILILFFMGFFLSDANRIALIGDSPFSYRNNLTSLNYVEKDLNSLNIQIEKLSENENEIILEIIPRFEDDSFPSLLSPMYTLLLAKHGYREKVIVLKCSMISMTCKNIVRVEGPVKNANMICIGCFLKKDLFHYKDSGTPIPFFVKKIPLP